MTFQGFTRLGLAAALSLAALAPAGAQGSGFLFHKPDARLTVRVGYDHANANSDLFKQVTEDLTLNKRDFSGLTFGGELGIPISDRIEIAVEGGYSRASKGSEFRHFIDNNDLPIEQTTQFERAPVIGSVRFYIIPPGRSIGKLAWIPSKFTTWVSAGAGTMWYRFRQDGDFVDFNTSNVYTSFYESSGWTTTGQVAGGVDVSLNSLVAIRSSVQSQWAKGPLNRDFVGFEKLDLSGVSATVGLTFRL